MADSFFAYARECVAAQLAYIEKERARFRKAAETPGDRVALAALNLHPLTAAEIEARLRQLDQMEADAERTHGSWSAGTRAGWLLSRDMTDRPLASAGLRSYRYRGAFGFVMIGALDHADALQEAARSIDGEPDRARLDVWDPAALVYVRAFAAAEAPE